MNSPASAIALWFLLATTAPLAAQEPATVHTVLPAPATVASGYELPGRTEPLASATLFTRATGIV
ncbi:MAG: hypothetical protein WCJ14_13105, partial [Verrucomicrobiota bacterium]